MKGNMKWYWMYVNWNMEYQLLYADYLCKENGKKER